MITVEEGLLERKAFAEKLEGFAQDEKMILTGYPKVIQGEDVIKGNVIHLYQQNEVVEVLDNDSSFKLKE